MRPPTKSKRPATKTAAKPPKTKTEENGLGGRGLDLPIGSIAASPFQPRSDFDKGELQELADSIAAVGIIAPIVVRPQGNGAGKYELVAGERRLRAAKLAGLEKIPAVVRELNDRQALEITVTENLQRADLNPIEEARAYEALLKKDDKRLPCTQVELGKRLGRSQGQISNRLRLLRLPAGWRKRIIAGEIPASHARYLLAYTDHPRILAAIEKQVIASLRHCPKCGEENAQPIALGEFLDCVYAALYASTRSMTRTEYVTKIGRTVGPVKPTDEQRKQLQIVKDPAGLEWAANTKLFGKLMAAEVERAIAEDKDGKKEKGGKGKGPGGKKAKAEPKKKLTAAQRKRLETEERAREKERTRKLAEGIWRVLIDWKRYLIARALREEQVGEEHLWSLLLYFAAGGADDPWTATDVLAAVLAPKPRGIGLGRPSSWGVWKGLAKLEDRDRQQAAIDWMAEMFWSGTNGPQCKIRDEEVAAIAGELLIDVPAAWRKEKLGPLFERYLNLHGKAQLVKLAEELKVKLDPAAGKDQMVQAFLSYKKSLPMPREILKAKRVTK